MDGPGVAAAVAEAHRREWAFVLAATVRVTRDIDLAEECVQDAYAQALATWAERGVPAKPGAWLTTVARRRALDLLRREVTLRRALPLLVDDEPAAAAGDPFPDDRLRLVFTCCHPSLAPEAQVALTLRLLCGLSTAEVARAFLVAEPTMAARITRAKKKIAAARIPYRMPSVADLPERTEAVLAVVHLLFTTGHTAPAGADLIRRDLVERALDLARMLRALLPGRRRRGGAAGADPADRRPPGDAGSARTVGCCCSPSRTATRWDAAQIAEGIDLVEQALRRRPRSRHTLQAAIAAVHAQARSWADTDWAQGGRPLRHARRGVAVAGGGAQPGGGARDSLAGRRRDWRRWSRCPPSRSWPATATCRRRGRRSWPSSAGWPRRGRRTRRRSC